VDDLSQCHSYLLSVQAFRNQQSMRLVTLVPTIDSCIRRAEAAMIPPKYCVDLSCKRRVGELISTGLSDKYYILECDMILHRPRV
jgi:hypothetical protein